MLRGRVLGFGIAAILFSAAGALCQTTLPATTSSSRLPIPATAAIAVAQKQLQDICRNRLLSPVQLRQLALDTTTDPALRYAIASRALDLSASSGDVRNATAAAADLCSFFQSDPIELNLAIIERLVQNKHKRTAVILAMRTMDTALKAGRMPAVLQLTNCLQSHSSAVEPALQAAVAEVAADGKAAVALRPANAAIYAAIYQQRWDENLPALSKSGEYAELAAKDLAAQAELDRLAVADAWWQAGQSRGSLTGHRLAWRAAQIYEQLLPGLRGAHRELAVARLNTYQREALRWQGIACGVSRRVWREGVRDSKVLSSTVPALLLAADDPTVAKESHALFRASLLVVAGGQHQFSFIAGSSLRVSIDGQLVIDNPKAYAKRTSGEKLPIALAAGLHELEIEVASKSSQPSLKVTWITPALPDDKPIPADCLFHDELGMLP